MTPNQLPPLPEPYTSQRSALTNPHREKLFTIKQMHAYALAALAQQAQEPVAWLYVDTVWERYLCFSRPTGGGTITNLYATPPAPKPAPVDERAAFEASMREKHGWVARDFQGDSFGYFDGHTATAWLAWQARAALQSPAPQTGRWLPIASAPRGSGENGPRSVNDPAYVKPPDLLLIHPEGISVGYYDWYYHPGYGVGASQYEPVWRSRPDGAGLDGVTHWMPLPAAPQTKGQP